MWTEYDKSGYPVISIYSTLQSTQISKDENHRKGKRTGAAQTRNHAEGHRLRYSRWQAA